MTTSKEVCYEYMDNTPLVQKSTRFELKAIENVVRKSMRAYRSKKFDKLFATVDFRKWR